MAECCIYLLVVDTAPQARIDPSPTSNARISTIPCPSIAFIDDRGPPFALGRMHEVPTSDHACTQIHQPAGHGDVGGCSPDRSAHRERPGHRYTRDDNPARA